MSKINEFKEKISLVDFILSRPNLNFKISDKSKKNQIKLFRETIDQQGNVHKLDTLIVSRFKKDTPEGLFEYDHYFVGGQDWGKTAYTVIDFVHEYILNKNPLTDKIEFKQVFGVLDQYIKSDKYVHPDETDYSLKIHSERKTNSPLNENVRKMIKFPNQTVFDYLKSRGLNKEVYMGPLFVSTYGVYNYESPLSKKIFENPVFLYLNNQNKVRTFQQIVETTTEKGLQRDKYFLKDVDKADALFKSEKLANMNMIVTTEAPEKCMAHFQLSKKDFEEKNIIPYYLATGGNVSEEQLLHMKNIALEYKIPYIMAYDNDLQGEIYTLKTLCRFASPLIDVTSQTINNEKYITISFNPHNSKAFNNINEEDKYMRTGHQVELKLKIKVLGEMTYKDKKIIQVNDKVGKITFSVPHTKENFEVIRENLSKDIKKHIGLETGIQKSTTKDWVDDLERKDNLKVKEYKHPEIKF